MVAADCWTSIFVVVFFFFVYAVISYKVEYITANWNVERQRINLDVLVFGLRSRLDLAPKRLESRLSHHLMTRLDLKFS